MRVVLADDHGRYRDGLAEAIARDPRLELVEAVADGSGAVASVRRHRPEVALLDVRMPGIDGLEAARQLRGHCTTVILLTGSSAAALEGEASAAGAAAVLSKDLSRRDICRRVTELRAGARC